MGSIAAAHTTSHELNQWAEHIGEMLARQAYGDRGPDLQTSLADMERLLGPLLEQVAAGFLRTSATEQAHRLTDEAPCPTCGVGCPVTTQDQPRRMTTEHGDFSWQEPVAHCDRCGRSFFPAADRPQN